MSKFYIPELQALKGTMVMQIYAKLLSPNFHSGKSYVKKVTVFTLQQFVPTPYVKLRRLNQKLQVGVFQGKDFALRVAIICLIGKSQLKE